MSIDTGIIASSNVNVENSWNIGMKILAGMQGEPVKQYQFKVKQAAVIMKFQSSIQVDKESVTVDPLLLFQRMITTVNCLRSDGDLESAPSYELCNIPSALIDSSRLMRAPTKPQIAEAIQKQLSPHTPIVPNEFRYILDGGWLANNSFGRKL